MLVAISLSNALFAGGSLIVWCKYLWDDAYRELSFFCAIQLSMILWSVTYIFWFYALSILFAFSTVIMSMVAIGIFTIYNYYTILLVIPMAACSGWFIVLSIWTTYSKIKGMANDRVIKLNIVFFLTCCCMRFTTEKDAEDVEMEEISFPTSSGDGENFTIIDNKSKKTSDNENHIGNTLSINNTNSSSSSSVVVVIEKEEEEELINKKKEEKKE